MSIPENFIYGVVSGINTTAKQLYSGPRKPDKGIEIRALSSNSGVIYIGDANVTADNGFPVCVVSNVGESVFIPLRQPNNLYVIGDSNSVDDEVRFYFV